MALTTTNYGNPTEALAVIEKDQRFRVYESTSGRPKAVLHDDQPEWTREEFLSAAANRELPPGQLLIRPLRADGKVSSQRIGLDLSISNTSFSVGSPEQTPTSPVGPSPYAGAELGILNALRDSYIDERTEVWALRDKIEELQDENTALKLRIKELECAATVAENESQSPTNKFISELVKGPFGAIIATRLMGPEMADAVKAATVAASGE